MYPIAKRLGLKPDGSADGASLGAMLLVPGFHLKKLPDIILRSGQITGMLVPLIAISVVMQQILSLLGAKDFVTAMLANLGGYYPILFACMLIVLARRNDSRELAEHDHSGTDSCSHRGQYRCRPDSLRGHLPGR